MAISDKRKQSLYFPEEMLKEIQAQALRQDRSLSWIVQQAWRIGRSSIRKIPSVNEAPGPWPHDGLSVVHVPVGTAPRSYRIIMACTVGPSRNAVAHCPTPAHSAYCTDRGRLVCR